MNVGKVVSCIERKVSEEVNAELLTPFQAKEIRVAVFSMSKDKSPGNDGFGPGFYQAFWPIVGPTVTESCLSWISSGQFLVELNQTILVLIPKKNKPTSMKELRPIALCQVLYKILSKVLANRLKKVLPNVVSEN